MSGPAVKSSVTSYARGLIAPLILWAVCGFVLRDPIRVWLQGEQGYDEAALREWIDESRVFRETLAGRARDYRRDLLAFGQPGGIQEAEVWLKYEALQEHLKAMGLPTKIYPEQMPLFLTVYRFELHFDVTERDTLPPVEVVWDAELPRQSSQYRELTLAVDEGIRLTVLYQMHAYNRRQEAEQANARRFRLVALLAGLGTFTALGWLLLAQRRERELERQRAASEQQIAEAETRHLQEALARREAEGRHEEATRQLLEQQIATQAAEAQALELKTQMYANIGIMAGSYAHNIKNLLVRPNDLLRRCLEANGASEEQRRLLNDVRQTLGLVTDRLQMILRTVRRDPAKSQAVRVSLRELASELVTTWQELARDKWKIDMGLELEEDAAWVEADYSNLQQSIENLLFNARDATFEMRNHLREQARRAEQESARRSAIIEAAAWRGKVMIRVRSTQAYHVLEVSDNGIGMSEEVRKRCTEAHYSTKKDRALYEGYSTGMGLGLSFVASVLQSSGAELSIESAPLQGTAFGLRFRRGKTG